MLTIFVSSSPGRFYAVHVEKTIIAHILLNYDLKFADEVASVRKSFSWRSAIVPYVNIELLFRKRVI